MKYRYKTRGSCFNFITNSIGLLIDWPRVSSPLVIGIERSWVLHWWLAFNGVLGGSGSQKLPFRLSSKLTRVRIKLTASTQLCWRFKLRGSNVLPKILPFLCKNGGGGNLSMGVNWYKSVGVVCSEGVKWCKSWAAMGGLLRNYHPLTEIAM